MGEAQFGEPVRTWLAREWAARLQATLESMLDPPPRVESGEGEPGESLAEAAQALGEQHGPPAWWEQRFSAWPEAPFWIGVPEQTWEVLGARILKSAGIGEPEAAERRATFVELLGQSLESLAHWMGAGAGAEVFCGERRERAGPGAAHEFHRVQVWLGETELPPLVMALSAELGAARLPSRGQVKTRTEEDPAGLGAAARDPAPVESRMLELLLDVELPVSISFGRTHLPLKESLKLTTGSIVELNRGVGDPVDVIVNNCVIARGEVVVIEGNYGVRIRQIMSREALLRKLR